MEACPGKRLQASWKSSIFSLRKRQLIQCESFLRRVFRRSFLCLPGHFRSGFLMECWDPLHVGTPLSESPTLVSNVSHGQRSIFPPLYLPYVPRCPVFCCCWMDSVTHCKKKKKVTNVREAHCKRQFTRAIFISVLIESCPFEKGLDLGSPKRAAFTVFVQRASPSTRANIFIRREACNDEVFL